MKRTPPSSMNSSVRRVGCWRPALTLTALIAAASLAGISAQASSLLWQGANGDTTWDVGTSTNWLNGGVPSVYADGDSVLFDDNADSFAPNLMAGVQPGSVTVNATNNYLLSGSGSIGGTTSLTKKGTGTFLIETANTFSGPVYVDNGVLQLGSSSALGASDTNYVYVTNGATLDLNGQYAESRTYAISGSGSDGQGALTDETNTTEHYEVSNIILTGDATLGSYGRWDMAAKGGTFVGNGFNLTKVGPGELWLSPGDGTNGDLQNVGNIDIKEGAIGIRTIGAVGDPTKTITVETNTILSLWGNPGMLNKKMVLDSASLYSGLTKGESSNNWVGPITLNGTNYIAPYSAALRLWGPISGSGGFVKQGNNPLWLDGANTYTGPTLIQAGEIVLSTNGTLGASSLIDLGTSLTIDATIANNGLTLGAGQTFIGEQNSVVLGSFNLNTGATLQVGKNGPALMTVDNLSMDNATNKMTLGSDPTDTYGAVNSMIQDSGSLTLSGMNTIMIEPEGVLNTNTPYMLMQYGSLSGGLANLRVVSLNPSYTFTLLDPSTTAPYIEVKVSGAPEPLVWKGGATGAPNAWDQTSLNWYNTVTKQKDHFYNGGVVSFDDTASTTTVDVDQDINAAMTVNNASQTYTFQGGGNLAGILDKENSGALTLAMTNMPQFSAVTNNAGSIVFDQPLADSWNNFPANISDDGAGMGTIVQGGSNTVYLAGDNSYFNGTIVVTNGVLQYAGVTSLGTPFSTLYATNGGTLDAFNDAGLKTIVLSGAGYNGQGALNKSSSGGWYNVANLVFAGDVTIGSANRLDTKSSGSIQGNDYKLTKVGSGQFWIDEIGDCGIGDMDVKQGTLGFRAPVTMGDPTKTLTLEPNTVLEFWGAKAQSKNLVLEDALWRSDSVSNNLTGNITLIGTNQFWEGSDLGVDGTISGTGSIYKTHGGTLYLRQPNTYSGATLLRDGRIVAETSSALGTSWFIQIWGSKTLDVTALPEYTFGQGQMVGGSGIIAGNVVFGSGSTLEPSLYDNGTITMTINGDLSFQTGATNHVDVLKSSTGLSNNQIVGLDTVTMGGTLVVTNIGDALAGGEAIQLFSATNYAGSFATIIPATPGPGLAWDTSTLDTDGTLRVAVTTDLNPTNITTAVSGDQMTLSWPSSHLGWRLQVQTNAVGAGLGTNWVDVPDSSTTTQMSFTIGTNGSVFYRMVFP